MGNKRTEPVQIHEVGGEPRSTAPHDFGEELPRLRQKRGRNPYFIGAWIIVSLSTAMGVLWLLGVVQVAPELPGNVVTVEAATGLISGVASSSGSTVLEKLAELGPGLFLFGLSGALALLIVQGLTRRKWTSVVDSAR